MHFKYLNYILSKFFVLCKRFLKYFPLVHLSHVQLIVSSLLFHQLGMTASLDNMPLVYYQNSIAMFNGGQAMGNHQHGAALGYLVDLFGLHVAAVGHALAEQLIKILGSRSKALAMEIRWR